MLIKGHLFSRKEIRTKKNKSFGEFLFFASSPLISLSHLAPHALCIETKNIRSSENVSMCVRNFEWGWISHFHFRYTYITIEKILFDILTKTIINFRPLLAARQDAGFPIIFLTSTLVHVREQLSSSNSCQSSDIYYSRATIKCRSALSMFIELRSKRKCVENLISQKAPSEAKFLAGFFFSKT